MIWLEMSRDESHGGGDWGFTHSLWSPTRKKDGYRWAFWDSVSNVRDGDSVVHLRGKGKTAAFVGHSTADGDGSVTDERPPAPGEWDFTKQFYRVKLRDYSPFESPLSLPHVFNTRGPELLEYYRRNKEAKKKEHIFFVYQAKRLQCLNGAYCSELSTPLVELLLDSSLGDPAGPPTPAEVRTGEQIRNVLARSGQNEFSKAVRHNYGFKCCFPDCEVNDPKLLVGAHISRWTDDPVRRGYIDNGLCLCLFHDKAFEIGYFTLAPNLTIHVESERVVRSPWALGHIAPFAGQPVRCGKIKPSLEALAQHWARTRLTPIPLENAHAPV